MPRFAQGLALLIIGCHGAGATNSAILKQGESLIFENTELCEAVIKADKAQCETPDCKALLGDNALVCQTGDCAAIIQHDETKCTNDDCKALVNNEVGADGKRTFTGSASACASSNCRALIRGQAGLCTSR